MLTTVAVLIILLGLMVSLARYVRDRSAQELTRTLLKQLDGLMAQYIEHNGGRLPEVKAILPPDASALAENAALTKSTRENNEQCIRALKADHRAHRLDLTSPIDPFEDLPFSAYDHRTIRDAWGSPVVFMAGQHYLIGLAPSRAGQDQYFFFSAGPDRKYLTREDNLYSYETTAK